MSKEEIKELAEDNAIYEFRKFQKIYGDCTDEYVRHFCNKLAELRSGIDDVCTCNCRHNSNSRDNEPCYRCDSRKTNADRIRNMSDEELAEFLVKYDISLENKETEPNNWLEWLQSEVEEITTDMENLDVRR